MLDIVICIIPKINPDAPTVGPALLKAHLLKAGFSCEVLDLNIKLFNELKKNNEHNLYYFDNDTLFMSPQPQEHANFVEFYRKYEFVFLDWIQLLKSKNPRFIGLSLLSIFSKAVSVQLSHLIRQHIPEAKIVWGGPQVDYDIDPYINAGLIDHFVTGDGELGAVELLRGNLTAPGIDKKGSNQTSDMSHLLIPNYDDIKWSEYPCLDFPNSVYLTGSRGCVKRCTFCNVFKIWPKYSFRSSEDLIGEIKVLKEKYGRKTFKFTDSLINGSNTNFRSLLAGLKTIKQEDPEFAWISQWIIRPQHLSREEDFKMMKESGCLWLDIGVESFSEGVRFHMGKKFSDQDLWWCLEILNKYEINSSLLMIVGYPTETEKDHQHAMNTVNRLFESGLARQRSQDGNFLINFSFSSTLMLDETLPLWKLVEKDIKNYKSSFEWDYEENTLPVRRRRFNEINQLVLDHQQRSAVDWHTKKAMNHINKL